MTCRVVLLAVGLAAAGGASGEPGDLDPTFGSNGLARVDDRAFGDPGSDSAATVFAQADGKLLAGSDNLGQTDFTVVRLNADGSLDSGFGEGGRTRLDVPGVAGRTAFVMQGAQGGVIVGGTSAPAGSYCHCELALAKFFSDGRVDPSFGTRGVTRVQSASWEDIETAAVVEQGDGKLVVAATSWSYNWDDNLVGSIVLFRFDSAGVIDSSFGAANRVDFDESGTSGVLLDPSGGGAGSVAHWLTQQADGKLIAVGYVGSDMAVLRLTADGVLDPSFDGDGIVILPAGTADAASSGWGVAVQTDGRIVVGGTVYHLCDTDDPTCVNLTDAVLLRLNPDGSLDSTFGSGGRVTFDAGGINTKVAAAGVVLEPSGAIVVGGSTTWAGGPRYGFLTRFTSTGELDTTFGAGGTTLIDAGRDWQSSAAQMRGITRFANGDIGAALSAEETDESGFAFDNFLVARATLSGVSPGVLGFEQTEITADEGSDATFVVRRTGGFAGQVSVDFATRNVGETADAADFKASAGTLTWADGDSATRTIKVPVTADGIVEPTEMFSIALSNATGGAVLAARFANASITDVNANAGVLQFETDSATTLPGAWLLVKVTRTQGQTGAVSVHYASIGGTAEEDVHFAAQSGSLQWGDGDAAPRTIAIQIMCGLDEQATKSFRLIASAPSGGATLGANSTLTVAIHGAPAPGTCGVSAATAVIAPSGSVGGGGGSTGALDVALLGLLLAWSTRQRIRRADARRTA
jgi:uncharacterized delta-60 repeat protein